MAKINVISHRGANRYAPQNTMPAFKKSIELGVDGFETDVHLTKDGQLVICHNYTIDETSDGKGKVSEMTLSQLEKFDFGSYFSPKYKGEKIPTVDEFLSFVSTTDIKVLNIEIKSPEEAETEIVKETIRLAKLHGVFDRLLISSFDPKLLVEAKEIDSSCKTGFLYSVNRKITYQNKLLSNYVDFAKSISADALHPQYLFVDEKYVETAHEAGIMVNPWTVDSVRAIEKMIRCGVDGIITDFPDVTNGLIEKHTY
ncbi:MAG: glycerophosphodiester phosphodiesterase [Clostridia bacterium]|nr:glycerophosphodiester phosphodiesterase [Clostridia bacterium]